jgi:hypothetical protein
MLFEQRQWRRGGQSVAASFDLAGSGYHHAAVRRPHAVAVDRIAKPIAHRINWGVRVERQPEAEQPLAAIIARAQPGLADRLAHRMRIAKDRFVLNMESHVAAIFNIPAKLRKVTRRNKANNKGCIFAWNFSDSLLAPVRAPSPAISALALVAVLEVASDLRHHELSCFSIQIRDPIDEFARLLAFKNHHLLGMPEDKYLFFALAIREDFFVKPAALVNACVYLARIGRAVQLFFVASAH